MPLPPSYGNPDGPHIAMLPQVDPAARGVGLANDMVQAAGALAAQDRQNRDVAERVTGIDHETAMIEDRRQLQQKLADRAAALATGQAGLLGQIADLKVNAGPGAAGHEEAVGKLVDDWTDNFMGTLDDPRLVAEMKPEVARIAGSLKTDAHVFAIAKRGEKQATDIDSAADQLSATLLTDPSDSNLATANGVIGKAIDAAFLPQDKKDELKRAYAKKFAVAGWKGAALLNPEGALAALDKGALNATGVDDKDLTELRRFAETEITRRQVASNKAANEQKAAVLDRATTLEQQVADGVASQAIAQELGTLAQAFDSAGDHSKADALRKSAINAGVLAGLQGATPVQLTGQIAKIEADPNWRQDPVKVRLHDAMGRLRETKRNAEPEVAAPNWFDPADIARYETEVRTKAAAAGIPNPQYLTKDLVATLHNEMGAGSQGKAQVLDLIGRMSPAAAFSAARQLDPNDYVFHLAATLPGPVRGFALSGRERLAKAPDLAPPAKVKDYVARTIGPALAEFPGEYNRAVTEATASIAAELEARGGKNGWDPDSARTALHLAVGGLIHNGVRTGGIGAWRGVPVLLPDRMTQDDWETKLSRLSGPINGYASGHQLTAEQLRRNYWPRATAGGYHFVDAYGRPVMARDGTPMLWRP